MTVSSAPARSPNRGTPSSGLRPQLDDDGAAAPVRSWRRTSSSAAASGAPDTQPVHRVQRDAHPPNLDPASGPQVQVAELHGADGASPRSSPPAPNPSSSPASTKGPYERLTERALAMFDLNDALARVLYRGTGRWAPEPTDSMANDR